MRRLLGFLSAGAMVVGLAGCWPLPGQGPDREAANDIETGFGPASVAGFTVRWTAVTGAEAPQGVGNPVLSTDGTVFVTTDRTVNAYDAATGASRWVSTPAAPGPTFEAVDTDLFLFNNLVLGSIRVSGNSWYAVQCTPATGHCDSLGGEQPGRLESVRPPGFTLALSRFIDQPGGGTEQHAMVFGGPFDTVLTDQPGAARLTVGTTQFFHAGVGVGTAPANGVRAFPLAGGAGGAGWATPIDGAVATSPVLGADGATVYVGTDAGTLWALATSDGHVLWSAPVGSAVTDAPALTGGTLYVPTAAGSLVALTAAGCGAATCAPRWSTPAGSPLTVQPAAAAGVVFTGAADGRVAAFPAAGCGAAVCDALWSVATGSRITTDPAVSLGKLFVGTEDGRLIAYGLPPG